MERYECKTAQAGFAAGRAWVIRPRQAETYRQGDARAEDANLMRAVEEMDRHLAATGKDGSRTDTALMDTERMILNGEEFLGEIRRGIREEGLNAPEAVKKTAGKLCAMLEESGTDYIRERCDDIRGLADGLEALLMDGGSQAPEEACILVADEISPAELLLIGTENVHGILTRSGSPTSHVSVLAGNLGIPYLYGLENILVKISPGDYLILDTEKGAVFVNPAGEAIREAEARQEVMQKKRAAQRAKADTLVTRTAVCANISCAEEAEGAWQAGMDGVGLLRSEFLFLNRQEAPLEDEQFEAYRHAAEAMGGREVVIRTMDIGSDKQAGWLGLPQETNPALGLRGLRVSLAHRELFRTQLRALLRAAAYGEIKIMIPMVASEWELDEAAKEMRLAGEELSRRGERYRVPEMGVMIETPAAVMIAPALAKKAAFFSIGTNDLTQYTLAVDREANDLEPYLDPLHDAVLRMIALTVEAAHANGIRVAVCGELAGDERAIEKLLRLGVDELSVSVSKAARVRSLVAEAEKRSGREGSQAKEQGIFSPAEGEMIPMQEIPDPVFSGGMMGECIGILSTDGKIYAPLSGTVSTVAAAGHAISFRNGSTEILVHVGLDTVKLNGEGFQIHVREGESVEQGQLVMEADLERIRDKGFNPMVIVVRLSAWSE